MFPHSYCSHCATGQECCWCEGHHLTHATAPCWAEMRCGLLEQLRGREKSFFFFFFTAVLQKLFLFNDTVITVQAVAFRDESLKIHNRKLSAIQLLCEATFSALKRRVKVTTRWMTDPVLKVSQWVLKVRWMLLLISHAVPHELLSNFALTKWESDQFVDAPLFQQRALKTKHPCPEKCQSHWLCWEMVSCTKRREMWWPFREGILGTPSAMFKLRDQNSFNSWKGCWKSCSSATPGGKAPTIPHSIKKHIANTGDEGLPIDGDHKFQNLLCGSNHPSSGWVLPQHGYVFGEKMSA